MAVLVIAIVVYAFAGRVGIFPGFALLYIALALGFDDAVATILTLVGVKLRWVILTLGVGVVGAVAFVLAMGPGSFAPVPAVATPPEPQLTVYQPGVAGAGGSSSPSPSGVAARWAMLGHDAQRTGRSPYTGPPQPRELWQLSLGSEFSHSCSSPCVSPDGTVYVGIDRGLLAVNPDGSRKWLCRTEGVIDTSPAAAADGTVYAVAAAIDVEGYLYAIAASGAEKWRVSLGTRPESSPAIGSDGTIYVCDRVGSLFAFTASGRQKWKFDGDGDDCLPSLAVGRN